MKQLKFLLLTIIISTLTCSSSCGQATVDKNFIGYWTTNGSQERTVIFKDKDDILQMVLWDSSSGEEVGVVKIQVLGDTIKTTEKVLSTNWVTYNTYSIIDENTLKCSVGGDAPSGTIIYLKRVK